MVQDINKAPVWGTDPGVTLEPLPSEQAAGWPQNFKPPARWQNWWQNQAYNLLDNLYSMLVKDWRPSPPLRLDLKTTGGGIKTGAVYHNGTFLTWIDTTTDGYKLFSSRDGRSWQDAGGAAAPIAEIDNMISDGSRLVVLPRASALPYYSDDDGSSWTVCIGAAAGALGTGTYFPNADLWICRIGTSNYTSADGITWAAATGWSSSAQDDSFAEDPTGVFLLAGSKYSSDSGVNWASQTLPAGAGNGLAVWSVALGGFVGLLPISGTTQDTHLMSGTFGTWVSLAQGSFAGVAASMLVELHSALVVARVNGTEWDFVVSNDLGVTWEGGAAWFSESQSSAYDAPNGSGASYAILLLASDPIPEGPIMFTMTPAFVKSAVAVV